MPVAGLNLLTLIIDMITQGCVNPYEEYLYQFLSAKRGNYASL